MNRIRSAKTLFTDQITHPLAAAKGSQIPPAEMIGRLYPHLSQRQATTELQKLSSPPSQHKNSRVPLMLQLPVESKVKLQLKGHFDFSLPALLLL